MGENRFVGAMAARYDDVYAHQAADDVLGPMVDVLVEVGGGGRALELAIGTGRVGLALAARGVEVHGIELSEEMVELLLAKPGAGGIGVTVGDMTTTRVPGEFSVVYLVANTIMNLTTQDEQVACFANAAAHLEPGGCFVVECIVPALRRLPPGQTVVPFDVSAAHVGFDEFTDLTEAQISYSHHIWLDGDRADTFSLPFRYVWPSELDLMARLAGMTLRDRWATFSKEPFTGESASHVSVWERGGP